MTTSFATWIQMTDPTVMEALAFFDLDYFIIDMEHSYIGNKELANLVRAIPKNSSTKPLVRVKDNNALDIRLALDMGAKGVIVPMIETEEQAKKAVAAAKYPPQGVRGTSYCKMNFWGEEFASYQEKANGFLTLIMIETVKGLRNIENILSVKGVDGVLFGAYDFSSSCGYPGQLNNRIVLDAEKKLVKECKERGMIVGTLVFAPDEEKIKKVQDVGFNLVSIGSDIMFMKESAKRFLNFIQG